MLNRAHITVLILVVVALAPANAYAQLISPGELIQDHEVWDTIESCTTCHELGNRGISDSLCLNCHFSLESRMNDGLGLHATFDEPNCATCHKDHFGRDFDSIRFDTLSFDHEATGYELLLSHEETSCLSCHSGENLSDQNFLVFQSQHVVSEPTFLGLIEDCESCHGPDNVHESQFELVACSTCHDSGVWEEVPLFDHDDSEYPLTGEHFDLSCETCHEPATGNPDVVVYKPLEFAECSACHEDVHAGTFGSTCASCHATTGWNSIAASDFETTFDHDVTEFPLIGLHESATCASCHNDSETLPEISIQFIRSTLSNQYPHPVAEACESCHVDNHDGSTDPVGCVSCHTEFGWAPSEFDVFRHQEETEYPLEGAHMAVLCAQCHIPASGEAISHISFEVEDQTCEGCHLEDDPHEQQFSPETCDSCHAVESWIEASSSFDHSSTEFPLAGSHAIIACSSCHTQTDLDIVEYRELDSSCASCHEDENPHGSQFEATSCATCHDDVSFRLTAFDHDLSGWPLEGAHTDVSCASCHEEQPDSRGEMIVQYRGVKTECKDCHSGGNENEE